jgi:branched-chain amino acid transport system permease protein
MSNRNFFERAEHGAEIAVEEATDAVEAAVEKVEEEIEVAASGVRRFFAEPRRPGPLAVPLVLAGAALLIVASVSSWITTYRPEMGDLDFWWTASGTRTFTLVAGVVALGLALAPWRGKRVGGLGLGFTMVVVMVGYLVQLWSVAGRGGELDDGTPLGTGSPSLGIIAAVVGSVLVVLGFRVMSDGGRLMFSAQTKRVNQVIGVVVAFAMGLGVVVFGLRIEESNRFLVFLALVGAVSFALGRLGVFEWLSESARRNLPLTSVACGLAAAVFPFTQQGDGYWIRVFASVLVFSCAAIGLNIVVGLAGLLDLGYIAFFGVGAYTAGILGGAELSYYQIELPFGLVIVIGAVVAAIFGVIIGAPTLRLEGDYLAIVTLAFGEIFYEFARNDFAKLTRGPNGVAQIPNLDFFGKDFATDTRIFGVDLNYFANYYFLELLLLAFVVLVFVRMNNSRIGRAWVAIREDEVAAQAMGVNTIGMKLLAFAIGAFLAGSAGTVNAHLASQVSPDSYTFFESILLLAACVLGGLGSVNGAVLGAVSLYVIPEKLRFFKDYRLMLFGLALVLMMRFRPEGIVANKRNRRGSSIGAARSKVATSAAAGTGPGSATGAEA